MWKQRREEKGLQEATWATLHCHDTSSPTENHSFQTDPSFTYKYLSIYLLCSPQSPPDSTNGQPMYRDPSSQVRAGPGPGKSLPLSWLPPL